MHKNATVETCRGSLRHRHHRPHPAAPIPTCLPPSIGRSSPASASAPAQLLSHPAMHAALTKLVPKPWPKLAVMAASCASLLRLSAPACSPSSHFALRSVRLGAWSVSGLLAAIHRPLLASASAPAQLLSHPHLKLMSTGLEMDAAAPTPALEPGLEMTQFSDESNDSTFHFQILRLVDQLYVWIGCNSARMGNLYAALPTRWDKTASVAALIGGGAESTGASMARRLSIRTGWSIILASNIPHNAPVLESFAEQRLFQELRTLGYVKPASRPSSSAATSLTPI